MPNSKSWADKGIEKILSKPEYANRKYNVIKNALPEKMSAILLNFAAPLIDSVEMSDKAVAESTIKMATFIWNYAVIKNGKPSKELGILAPLIEKEVERQKSHDPVFKMVLENLLERKQSLYPDNNRMISDFDITWSNEGASMHLTVFASD